MLLYDVIHYSSPAYCLSSTQSQNEATNNLQRLWMDSELSKISGNQLLKGCAMLSSFGKAQNSKPLKKFCSPRECDRTLLKSCNGRNVLIFVSCHFALWWWWTFSYIHFQQNICNTMYISIINDTWSYSFLFVFMFPTTSNTRQCERTISSREFYKMWKYCEKLVLCCRSLFPKVVLIFQIFELNSMIPFSASLPICNLKVSLFICEKKVFLRQTSAKHVWIILSLTDRPHNCAFITDPISSVGTPWPIPWLASWPNNSMIDQKLSGKFCTLAMFWQRTIFCGHAKIWPPPPNLGAWSWTDDHDDGAAMNGPFSQP